MTEQIKTQNQTGNPLGFDKIPRLLARFAIPSIIALLASSLYNIVDQIFIGWGVGYLGNAATTVAFPFTTICLALALLIGIGAASNFSLQLGKKNVDKAQAFIISSLVLMVVVSLAYLVLGELFLSRLLPLFGSTEANFDYARQYSSIILVGAPALILSNGLSQLIRADGSPRFSMTSVLAGAVLNTILDPIFIFVFNWGIAGAAWATVIGQYASLCVCLLYLKRFKTVKLSWSRDKVQADCFLNIVKLGASPSLNQIAILIVQIVLNNSLSYYGTLSVYGPDIPIAAAGICMKLNGLFASVMIGLSQGGQPIIGYNYGARQFDRVKKTVIWSMGVMLVLGSLVEMLFQFFPEPLILLFGQGEELYIQFSVLFLRTYLSTICIAGLQSISSNFFTAIGKPVKGIFLSLSRQIIFYIPFALWLPAQFGLEGILFAAPIADIIAVLISLFFDWREFKLMDRLEVSVS